MPEFDLDAVSVRPIRPDERARFDVMLDEHHWLGHRLVGETMRYVALGPEGQWLAVLGFGAAALACRPRDCYIGWSDEQHFRRLRYVTNNQRFCVLPAGRRNNLASNVLAKTLKRLSADFEVRWGHPVVMVETFVDPARHRGTCYTAGGFVLLGQTLGYGRSGGRYHHHGRVKLTLARLLRRDARKLLTSPFDHRVLTRGSQPMIDLNTLDFDSDDGLIAALEQIVDHRKRRGVRHSLPSLLAIGEYAADCPQPVLARLGAKHHPVRQRYVAPHRDTIRRALALVDGPRSTRSWVRGCSVGSVPDISTRTSSWSRWTASRCGERCEPTAVRCTCSLRWSTVQESWSHSKKWTSSPTRSPRFGRCWKSLTSRVGW